MPADHAAFPSFDQSAVERIARAIEATGCCRLDDVIAPGLIAEARRQAEAQVIATGGEYVAITGKTGLTGYLLSDIHADPAFADLLRRLYRAATGGVATGSAVHQVLRCLKGATARQHADYLHYDSYVVTILVPLAVPAEGPAGDLVLLPNRRPIRRSYLLNALEKLRLDRSPVQRWLWRRIAAGQERAIRLTMQPGSVYIFWGYRSLHANTPSDPKGLRATLLYHFGNPHDTSPLRRWRGR